MVAPPAATTPKGNFITAAERLGGPPQPPAAEMTRNIQEMTKKYQKQNRQEQATAKAETHMKKNAEYGSHNKNM